MYFFTLVIFAGHIQTVCRSSHLFIQLFYSAVLSNFISLLSVEVSLVTNCIQRERSNNLLLLHQGCQHIENGTAADEGEVGGGGGGGADKNMGG